MSSSQDFAIQVHEVTKAFKLNPIGHQYKTLRTELAQLFSPGRRENKDSGRELLALNNVTFDVHQGEILGIVGRNGSGKSTLLKILSRITWPTSGHADIFGSVGALLEVGTGFHPELTGRENVFLSGSILGMNRSLISDRFDEIVDFAGVGEFIDTPIKHFSSGMRMRLAFSVAAHLQPDILLVDEVLAVGDHDFQRKCLGRMGEIAETGRTVLFVSHNLKAIKSLCSRIIVLDSGKIIKDSTDVESAINFYLNSQESWATYGEWIHTNPDAGNPWYYPARMALLNEYGKVISSAVDDKMEKYVELEFDMLSEIERFALGIAIFDNEGQLLFISMQYDDPEHAWPNLKPGRNILRLKLPSNVFNEGRYRIEWISQILPNRWVHAPNGRQPGIWLEINEITARGKGTFTNRPGPFAPSLSWEKIK